MYKGMCVGVCLCMCTQVHIHTPAHALATLELLFDLSGWELKSLLPQSLEYSLLYKSQSRRFYISNVHYTISFP